MTPLDILWFFFLLSSLQPLIQQRVLAARRARPCTPWSGATAHAPSPSSTAAGGLAILGIPFGGFIDIEDSEAIIRAIEMTSRQMPIDMVLHTSASTRLHRSWPPSARRTRTRPTTRP